MKTFYVTIKSDFNYGNNFDERPFCLFQATNKEEALKLLNHKYVCEFDEKFEAVEIPVTFNDPNLKFIELN
ncbi:hypothetical protein M0R19_05090 [Candidatus Pacearchaeota archaeon]|jgi:hypothetical protein|nr:hypothetical protein [Candidatus Pacearchaeota archaeon]